MALGQRRPSGAPHGEGDSGRRGETGSRGEDDPENVTVPS
jgi:hypothetical protein